uniref:Uncharacterized protein n=1 Tax=Anguilla anguilla TaxID=7936 RepID=A0A0E9PTJ8_ANGAN
MPGAWDLVNVTDSHRIIQLWGSVLSDTRVWERSSLFCPL